MDDINTLPYDPDKFLFEAPKEPEVVSSRLKRPAHPGFRPQPRVSVPLNDLLAKVVQDHREKSRLWFTYTKLPKGHIRVVVIRQGQSDDALQLDIHSVSRDRLPSYSALSYEWGEGPEIHPVILRDYTRHPRDILNIRNRLRFLMFRAVGTRFFLRTNLYAALRQLRRPDESVKIWVDAICINQLDDEEKAEQVARMAEIYNRAFNVPIWLGVASRGSDMAMDFVNELGQLQLLNNIIHDKEALRKWAALIELMHARWFSRRWVIQEIAMAKDASVHCGSQKVHWDDFADAISILTTEIDNVKAEMQKPGRPLDLKFKPETLDIVEALGARKLSQVKANLLHKSLNGKIIERHSSLEHLVSSLVSFDASDPRDTIFALLSIARENPERQIWPNYKKSLLEVYTEFTNHCIKSSNSLDVICRHWAPVSTTVRVKRAVGVLREITRIQVDTVLPSWISRLDKSAFGTPEMIFRGRRNANNLVGAHQVYSASSVGGVVKADFGIRTVPLTIEKDILSETFDGTLTVRGFVLGKINEISGRIIPGKLPQEVLEMGGWIYSYRDEERTVNDVPDQLWKSLIANRDENGNSPESYHRKACLYCLQQEDVNGDVDMNQIMKDPSVYHRFISFLRRVEEVVWNRKAFRSGISNQNFGLCSRDSIVGDLVCILYGCSVPVVLRPVEQRPVLGQKKVKGSTPESPRSPSSKPGESTGHQLNRDRQSSHKKRKLDKASGDYSTEPIYYQVIGECYVHGKMDGEAMDTIGRAESEQNFTLV